MASPPTNEARGAEATTPPALDPNSPEAQSAELLNAVVGQIFSTRRPRDVCAGAASAFKSVAKGFALGVATLIAAPAAAAYNQPEEEQQPQQPQQTQLQRLGTMAGAVGAGIAGAVLLPLAGAVVGFVQVVRGAWNTPSAVYHCVTGDQVWDAEEREWKDKERYVLAEEAARVRAEAEAEGVDVPAALLMSGSSTTSTSSTPARRPSRP